MADEIERKFLVDAELLSDLIGDQAGKHVVQGYLNLDKERTVRVRIVDGEQAFFGVKGKNDGIRRPEFEYPIPVEDAQNMMRLTIGSPIEKIRYEIEHEGHTWEVDEFQGDNKGLWLAEIELSHEDEPFVKPDWAGREVSLDPRYYNSNLAQNPYTQWTQRAARNCAPHR